MSKPRNYFLVTAWISTPKSMEYVWERVIDRAKLGKKTDAVFGMTLVDKDYVDNAAERALSRIEERFWDPLESGSEQGLLLAKDILQEELRKYHGE